MPEHLWLAAPASIYINHNMAYHCSPKPFVPHTLQTRSSFCITRIEISRLVPNLYIHVSVSDINIPIFIREKLFFS
jgi:hypothetical protein